MNNQLSTINRVLQERGHRLTAAREAIVRVLLAAGGHVSADGLVELVQAHTPGIGRMTVYRTLDLLAELGLARPVYQGTGAAHYVMLEDGHHHHLVCSHCAGVFEFDDCSLDEIAQAISSRFNFQVQGHLLEFYGLCQECRT